MDTHPARIALLPLCQDYPTPTLWITELLICQYASNLTLNGYYHSARMALFSICQYGSTLNLPGWLYSPSARMALLSLCQDGSTLTLPGWLYSPSARMAPLPALPSPPYMAYSCVLRLCASSHVSHHPLNYLYYSMTHKNHPHESQFFKLNYVRNIIV